MAAMAAASVGIAGTADPGSSAPPWSISLTTIPRSFNEHKIEAYRASRLTSSRQDARSHKFLTEAYVEPSSVRVSNSSVTGVHIKASCFRSQKKTAKPYKVSVNLLQSGDVEGADCECAAGKSGACNHSLALLKLLALLRAKDYQEVPPAVSCTELPQQWRRPRGEAVASTSLQSVDWRSVRKEGLETPITSKLYDAQRNAVSFNDRMASIQVLGENLFSCQASPFAKHLRRATAADPVETKFGLAPVGSLLSYQQSLVPFGYDTFISPEVGHVQERNRVLPCEPAFFDSRVSWNMSGLNLPVEQDLLLKSLLVTSTDATCFERNTRQQSKSPLWKAARQSRLTASSFGDAATRESWTLKGLINLTSPKDISHVRAVRLGALWAAKVCSGMNKKWPAKWLFLLVEVKVLRAAAVSSIEPGGTYDFLPATNMLTCLQPAGEEHGIKYEPVAVQRYETSLRALGHDIQTFSCGILVRPDCPWLGASPDRVVWDPTEATPHGVVEVKCPYTLRDGGLDTAVDFYMEKDTAGVYRLNRTIKNYYQILGQMALSGLLWGDFVVYSHQFLIVERIHFSDRKWSKCKAALDNFYFSVLLPHLCKSSA